MHSTSIILTFSLFNVLFVGHNLISEVFLAFYIDSFYPKAGGNPQIHTIDIFYGQKPLVISTNCFIIGNCNFFINF